MEEIKIRSLRNKQKENLLKAEDFFHNRTAGSTGGASPEEPMPNKQKYMASRIAKPVFFTIFVFAVGGLGGIWLDRILLPTLLVKYPALGQYEYFKNMSERTTVVHETKEVKISQEEAISGAIEKVSPAIAEITRKNASGQEETAGSGIVLTSDGYIIVPLQSIYVQTGNASAASEDIKVKLKNGKSYSAQIAAQDTDYGLAILKIEESNLSVIPYAAAEDLKLGQKIIMLNGAVNTDIISKFIEDYKMPNSTDSSLQKRIQISQNLGTAIAGSAAISTDGKLVGIAQGENIVIPLSEIKDFIEKSIAR